MTTDRTGELLRTNDAYPPAVQPAGPGTPVTDPVQQDGEKTSIRILPCSHAVTRYDVKQERAAVDEDPAMAGQIVKRLCCPACGYIVRSMLATEYADNFQTPVLP